MLALVSRYFDTIANARTTAQVEAVLGELSHELGFRSGFLIEYGPEMSAARQVLDSAHDREGWWVRYLSLGLRDPIRQLQDMLASGPLIRMDESRFVSESDPMLIFVRQIDMVDCTLVPVSHDGQFVGLGGFSGKPELLDRQEAALPLIVYSLFAQIRSIRSQDNNRTGERLTPREREVMALSADGLTSQQIAAELGMSPRTVNQHVDNVSVKLGTKNRTHTVAEVIRHKLL